MKKTASIFILSILLIITYWILNSQSESNRDIISNESKDKILNELSKDWTNGLDDIKSQLNKDSDSLTEKDKAFLLGAKGVAELYLSQFEDSFNSLNQALKLNLKNSLWKQAGRNHLDLADYYLSQNDLIKQEYHIIESINLFRKYKITKDLIDAQMQLAYLHQQTNNTGLAITTYLRIIEQAKEVKDDIGEMLATNNLATVYETINDLEKAIHFAEIGLKMNLQIGHQEYINNSLIFLNKLYQKQNNPKRAIKSLGLALMQKIETTTIDNLLPVITEFYKLLVNSYQYDSADQLISAVIQYSERHSKYKSLAVSQHYMGVNLLHQKLWNDALEYFSKADIIYNQSNFTFKKDLNFSYMGLANELTGSGLKLARSLQTMANKDESNSMAQAIASLALSYSFYAIQNKNESKSWLKKSEVLFEKNKLYEYQLLLLLKKNLVDQNDLKPIDKEINSINDSIEQFKMIEEMEIIDSIINKLNEA